jgi:hypothetical protein
MLKMHLGNTIFPYVHLIDRPHDRPSYPCVVQGNWNWSVAHCIEKRSRLTDCATH